MEFELTKSDTSMANALRRVRPARPRSGAARCCPRRCSGSPPFAAGGCAQMIIAEVPTMAIDQVRAGAGPPLAIAAPAPQVG